MDLIRATIDDINNFGIMNDLVNKHIFKPADSILEGNGTVTRKWAINHAGKKKSKVMSYLALSYDDLHNNITGFDMAVYNAICSLYYYWWQENHNEPLYITPNEVYRRLTGHQNREGAAKPSKAQHDMIVASIDKLRRIDFVYDISSELKKNYIVLEDERLVGGMIKDYLLNCTEVEFKTDRGRKIGGYRINTEPILFTYNRHKKHIILVPFFLLNTSSVLNDTDNVIEFRLYLVQQITLMKNGNRSQSRIKLETLYRDSGVEPPDKRFDGKTYKNENVRKNQIRKAKNNDINKIAKILECWTNLNWIKGYKIIDRSGNAIQEFMDGQLVKNRNSAVIKAFDIFI